jgi:hypothetical protein
MLLSIGIEAHLGCGGCGANIVDIGSTYRTRMDNSKVWEKV